MFNLLLHQHCVALYSRFENHHLPNGPQISRPNQSDASNSEVQRWLLQTASPSPAKLLESLKAICGVLSSFFFGWSWIRFASDISRRLRAWGDQERDSGLKRWTVCVQTARKSLGECLLASGGFGIEFTYNTI